MMISVKPFGAARRPNGSARGAASHQPITTPWGLAGPPSTFRPRRPGTSQEWTPVSGLTSHPRAGPGRSNLRGPRQSPMGTEPRPALPLGEVGDPGAVGCRRVELALHQIGGTHHRGIWAGGVMPATATGTGQAEFAHESLDDALGNRDAFAVERKLPSARRRPR